MEPGPQLTWYPIESVKFTANSNWEFLKSRNEQITIRSSLYEWNWQEFYSSVDVHEHIAYHTDDLRGSSKERLRGKLTWIVNDKFEDNLVKGGAN